MQKDILSTTNLIFSMEDTTILSTFSLQFLAKDFKRISEFGVQFHGLSATVNAVCTL